MEGNPTKEVGNPIENKQEIAITGKSY